MIRLGLTGSIAMGKTTTAALFRELGIPVHDADATVHKLYAIGGSAVEPIGKLAPDAVVEGAVSREKLKALISEDPEVLRSIEAIVHPLVLADRKSFEAAAEQEGHDIIVFDVPLLFETGANKEVDRVVVVSAPLEVQRRRALERPKMTVALFEHILSQQMPDGEKRAAADYVIDTSQGLDHARKAVQTLLETIRAELSGNERDIPGHRDNGS
ncbi:MAG: dephospho-CoA kinase [Neomegalonema sp.]